MKINIPGETEVRGQKIRPPEGSTIPVGEIMTGELVGALREAWRKAFSEAKFPAAILDKDRKVAAANAPGQEWLDRRGGAETVLAAPGIELPLQRGRVAVISSPPEPEGMVLLGLRGGSMLLCPADGRAGAEDYVRLFCAFLAAAETAARRNDRLDVYHELLTHDAPNYITAVYGYLQMMQSQDLPPEKLRRYVDASIEQTEALNQLIDTARTLRQLETSPLKEVGPLDLDEAIARSVGAAREANRGKGAAVEVRMPPGEHVIDAETALPQAFTIVLDNAIRYSDAPEIAVEADDDGAKWHLRFEDNGRGIPDDKKEFVFLRFDRLDKQKKIRGSGLGLALARALVERHGGRIWVENRVPGDHTQGSVVHIVLPKRIREAASESSPAPPGTDRTRSG